MEVRVDVKVDGEDETQLRSNSEGARRGKEIGRRPRGCARHSHATISHGFTSHVVESRLVQKKAIKKELQMVHEMVQRPELSEWIDSGSPFFSLAV